tara:strand:+ start:426 stop:665 length:240 start_codon:yes stop_codon:yes gene_type:complete
MREIIKDHEYEYTDGVIINCFGDQMHSVKEYVEEMQFLLGEVRRLQDGLNKIERVTSAYSLERVKVTDAQGREWNSDII